MFRRYKASLFGLRSVFKYSVKKASEQEKERRNAQFSFSRELSDDDFQAAVYESAMSVEQIIDVDIDGPIVRFMVKSQRGLSVWCFVIDFNDHGSFTGKCWLTKEIPDSSIPNTVAERIIKACNLTIKKNKRIIVQSADELGHIISYLKCEYCDEYLEPVPHLSSFFCPYCGKKIIVNDYHPISQLEEHSEDDIEKIVSAKNYYDEKRKHFRRSYGFFFVVIYILIMVISFWVMVYGIKIMIVLIKQMLYIENM